MRSIRKTSVSGSLETPVGQEEDSRWRFMRIPKCGTSDAASHQSCAAVEQVLNQLTSARRVLQRALPEMVQAAR